MKDFDIMKSLIGDSLQESDLKYVDCYVYNKLGLFIPSMGACGYAAKENHTHPSYMIIIFFSDEKGEMLNTVQSSKNHYNASIYSPNIAHSDFWGEKMCYYCLMIDKDYFEKQFALYVGIKQVFNNFQFSICSDILKALNTFAFEYSKQMQNSDITLEAQSTIITHWIIRSILGETLDMRSISSNYSVGRVQQYIEQHYGENISVSNLADMVYVSESTLNRLFKKEFSLTPFEYLIETRVEKSKTMLRRKSVAITDIADRCGFSSNSHFTSCFKRIIGMSPSDYRKKYIE